MLIINEELLAIDQAIECLVSYFLKLPEAYEAFRPDVRELKRQVLRMKRQIDLNEVVIAYRHAEFDLQTILANLGEEIAQAVSGQIFIDTGLPLAPHKPHHKKGDTNIKEKMSHD